MASETFDIVIKQRGIDAIVRKIRAMGETAKQATREIRAVSTSLQSMPTSQQVSDPFQNITSDRVVQEIQNIATTATGAVTQMNALRDSILGTLSLDASSLISQITSLNALLESASQNSRDIRIPSGGGANTSVSSVSRGSEGPLPITETMQYQNIVSQTTGAVTRLRTEEIALNRAFQDGIISQSTLNTSLAQVRAELEATERRMNGTGESVGLASHHLMNFGYQANDVFVSLASGQNPVTVFIQQGAQIGQIMAQASVEAGGFSAMMAQVRTSMASAGLAFLGFLKNPYVIGFAAVIAGIYASFKLLQSSVQESTGVNATFLDSVKGITLYAGDWVTGQRSLTAEIQSTDNATKELGVTGSNVFPSLSRYIADTATAANRLAYSMSEVVKQTRMQIYLNNAMSIGGTFEKEAKNAQKWQERRKAIFNETGKWINQMEKFRKDESGKLIPDPNGVFAKESWEYASFIKEQSKLEESERNLASSKSVKAIEEGTQGRILSLQKGKALEAKNLKELASVYEQVELKKFEDTTGFKPDTVLKITVKENALKMAQLDIEQKITQEQAKQAKKKKSGGTKRPKLTQEDYYGLEAKKIEDSIKAMEVYGVEKNKILAISRLEQQMTRKHMTLSAEQKATIEQLIEVEYDRKKVYEEVSRLQKTGVEQERAFVVQHKAIMEAYQLGFITENQKLENLRQLTQQQALYNLEVGKGNELENLKNFQSSVFEEAGGQERFRKAQIGGIQQVANDTVGARTDFAGKASGVGSALASGDITQGQAFGQFSGTSVGQSYLGGTQDSTDYKLEQLQAYYDQVQTLRDNNIISEESASEATMKIWADEQSTRLQGASDFFGSLTGLAQSKNKTLSTIGKTAAISQAMINTYQSATGAYASMASIPYVGPALGAAAAAAAIAAGLANVAQIKSQGYKSGGYTGNMGINDIAGVVHGKEYVVNAQATRKNRPILEAMNSGKSVSAGGTMKAPNVIVNNMGTPQNYQVDSISHDEVRLIATDIAERTVSKRTPSIVSGQIKNPNSAVSKALGRSTTTQRKRTG